MSLPAQETNLAVLEHLPGQLKDKGCRLVA